jgi:hypothetical protein
MVAACVNPAALAGGSGELRAYLSTGTRGSTSTLPSHTWVAAKGPSNTTIDTPFVKVPGLLTAECVTKDKSSYLSVTVHANAEDPRTDDIPGDVVTNGQVQADWGLHLIDVPDVEMFDSQMKFRRLLLDYTDKRIAPMKDGAWHEFVNQLFSTIDNVQVSTDATRKGAFENWIDLYLSDSVQSAANWEKAACDNQPFLRDGRTYFVAEGFRLFLYTRFQERMTSQQLTVELTKLGYHYERMNVRTRKGGLTKRSCWRLS